MNTMMKALLACMPAMALAETHQIELSAKNMQGSDFYLSKDDALEFRWTGPGATPFQQPEHVQIREVELMPAPYTVTALETECSDVTEPIAVPDQRLALYVVDGHTQTWSNVMHPEFDGVFTSLQVTGGSDWAYGHNRLTTPGQSRIEIDYAIPVAEIRKHYPDARFKLDSAYFAPWNYGNSIIETTVNGHIVHDSQVVVGEHQGRTYHQADLTDILLNDEDGKIILHYEAGPGVLFLHYFQIVVDNLYEDMDEEMCTWKWLVEPTNHFSSSNDDDNHADSYATYDIQFTGPNNNDYHSKITVHYD